MIKGGDILKKRFIVYAFISFALFGCAQESETKTSIPQTEKNEEAEAYINTKTVNLELKESEEIALFERAVSNSTKESGMVNMATPQYQFDSGKNTYFLWITEESGTIMNIKDMHTIYTLSSKSVKEVYEFVHKD